MPNFISEDQIEQALVQKLQHVHGFDALYCYTENAEDLNDGSGRANKRDVILADRVREAAIRTGEPALQALGLCNRLRLVLPVATVRFIQFVNCMKGGRKIACCNLTDCVSSSLS
jgi:type I restriction enzyme R subunit